MLIEATHISRALDQVEAELSDNVIFASKYLGDLACNPSVHTRRASVQPRLAVDVRDQVEQELNVLLHDLQVDLGHVNLLAELRRELGAL